MSNATNDLENLVLDHVLGNTAMTQPTTLYVGLYTAITDGETGSWTEVSGTNYARKAVTFGAASGGTATNSADVEFDAAGAGGWGTVIGIFISNASTGGTNFFYGNLTASKTVDLADIFTITAGSLSISLA